MTTCKESGLSMIVSSSQIEAQHFSTRYLFVYIDLKVHKSSRTRWMDHPLVVRELWIQGCQNLGKSFRRKCLATKDWNLQQVVVWSTIFTDVPRPPFWEDVQLVWLVNKLNMRVSRSKLINGTGSRVISEGNHRTEGRLHFETTWIKRQQYHTYDILHIQHTHRCIFIYVIIYTYIWEVV